MYNKFDIMMTTVFVYVHCSYIHLHYLHTTCTHYPPRMRCALSCLPMIYDVYYLPMYHLVDCLFTTHAPSPPKSIVLPHVQSLSIPRCFNYTHTYSTVNQTLFQVICLLPPSISICMLQLSDSNSLK